MLVEQTMEKLVAMKMKGMAEALRRWLEQPKEKEMTPLDLVGLLADAEWSHREQRKLTGRLRTARFRQDACIEDIDYQHPRGLQKATMLDLAACRWVEGHQNVIFTGQTGVGKSYLACALGQKAHPEAARLAQVPGVGPITSLAYVLTVDDPKRFRRSRVAGAFLGLVPGKDQSGDHDPQKRVTRAGDPFLRRLLVQCAHSVLGWRGTASDLRTWGLGIAAGGGKDPKKRAIVAVARKLAVLLHSLWVSGEEYQPIGYRSAGLA